jgi:hypothetical protein
VVVALFLADLGVLITLVVRSGTVDEDEGRIVEQRGPAIARHGRRYERGKGESYRQPVLIHQ